MTCFSGYYLRMVDVIRRPTFVSERKVEAVRTKNPIVLQSGHCFVFSQRCPVSPLFILGLILPAGAVGFGSAVPVGLTPQDPLVTDGLLRTFPFTSPLQNTEYNLLLLLVVRVFNKPIFENIFNVCFYFLIPGDHILWLRRTTVILKNHELIAAGEGKT